MTPRWIYWVTVGFSVSLSTIMFYFAYRFVPRRRPRAWTALFGALLAAMMWEVAKQAFRIYIRSSPSTTRSTDPSACSSCS